MNRQELISVQFGFPYFLAGSVATKYGFARQHETNLGMLHYEVHMH